MYPSPVSNERLDPVGLLQYKLKCYGVIIMQKKNICGNSLQNPYLFSISFCYIKGVGSTYG